MKTTIFSKQKNNKKVSKTIKKFKVSLIRELSKMVQEKIKGKITIKHLWKHLVGYLLFVEIDYEKIVEVIDKRIQIRLE